MPVNPLSLKNLLSMNRLEAGVTSEVHRVRAPADVQAWFRAMSAEQRGELLTRMMNGSPAEAGAGRNARRSSEGPSRGSGELVGVTLLKVAAVALPSRLKNELRWSPSRYADLEAVLAGTRQVRLDRSTGKAVWRVDDNSPMRKDTVVRLFSAGVLTVED